MKKFSILFAVLAFAMFALVLSAFSQTELPAIDEAEAADFLGRWYMKDVCSPESCLDFQELGIALTYDVNTDNTIVVGKDTEEPSVNLWYMDNGYAYTIVQVSENKTNENEMYIAENGMLVVGDNESYATFTRELQSNEVSQEAVADAVQNDFSGEWYVKGIMHENEMIPSTLLGLDYSFLIDEETIMMFSGEDGQEASYIVEEGKLYTVFQGTDPEGKTWEEEMTAEYHDDGSLFVTFFPGTVNEIVMVFTHEPNKPEVTDTTGEAADTTAGAADTTGGAADTASGAAGIPSQVSSSEGDDSFDLGGLIGQFFGGENTDISGLIQQFTGGEKLDLNGLFDSLMSGEGGFDLNGLLEGMTSGGAEGESGFDLSGLFNMFGTGN